MHKDIAVHKRMVKNSLHFGKFCCTTLLIIFLLCLSYVYMFQFELDTYRLFSVYDVGVCGFSWL